MLSVDNDTLLLILHICITGDFSVSSFLRYQTFTLHSNYYCAKFPYWVILWSRFVNPIQVFPFSDVCTWSHTLNQEVLLSLKSNTHGMEEMLSALKVFLPWHKRVRLLQRGRVQLKQRGDVVPVSHRHQLVLDPLTERALVGATTIHLQRMWESRSSAEVESGQEAGERQQVHPLYFEGNAETHHRRWLSIISFISRVLLQKKQVIFIICTYSFKGNPFYSIPFYSKELRKMMSTSNNTDKTTIQWHEKRWQKSFFWWKTNNTSQLWQHTREEPQPQQHRIHKTLNAQTLQDEISVLISKKKTKTTFGSVSATRLPQQPGSFRWPGAWSGRDCSSVLPPHDTGHDGPPGGSVRTGEFRPS